MAIVGQTASGKSSLAMRVAQVIPSEIIAADSRTVYKGLDIGTAKPSIEDQQTTPHHLLDLVNPDQSFNVADFASQARQAITEINQRKKLPILVGGSGLYVDSILYEYSFGSEPNWQLRRNLQKLTIEALQAEIIARNLPLPENKQNKRYLVRILEKGETSSQAKRWRDKTLAVGLSIEQTILEKRIKSRLEEMLERGLLDEARRVLEIYSGDCEALKSNIYAALKPYFAQEISLQAACTDFIKRDLALAKKQKTWFKRHAEIDWFDDSDKAFKYICQKLKVHYNLRDV